MKRSPPKLDSFVDSKFQVSAIMNDIGDFDENIKQKNLTEYGFANEWS